MKESEMRKTVIVIARDWKVTEMHSVLMFGVKMHLKFILYRYDMFALSRKNSG